MRVRLGLESSDSAQSTKRTRGTHVGVRNMDRWISIGRPTAAYPFADQIASQPFDQNPTTSTRRPPRAPPRSRALCAMDRGVGSAAMCHFCAGSTGRTATHLMLVVHRPRKSSFHLLPSPSVLPWQSKEPEAPCRCSLPSLLLKLGVLLHCLPLAFPQP